ncbi:response regulator transcription factor [Halobacillus massiliensis]|uniref:response regulator transcription factor n=1 Tax=Halobacillus massiliensis TaxID=1926286 RepID=UPI0009E19577|nr:response regulator [Halobacillus massiliensis]
MKALIVDDEVNVRDVLRYLGQWEKHGITEIFEADNGKEAQKIINEVKPELIFTDIKMPEMSGMEFIEWLDSKNYVGKVIFITGYNDYSLMRQAIKYSSFDYLLKPIEPEFFNKTLAEAVESWKTDQKSPNFNESIEEDFKKLRIDQIITSACMGEPFEPVDILSYLPASDQYELSLISFYQMHHPEPYIENLSKRLFDQKIGNVFSLKNGRNLCLVITITGESLTAEQWMSQEIDLPVRLVSGRAFTSLKQLARHYQALQTALDNNDYRSIHRLNELDAARRNQDIVAYVDDYYMEELSLEKLSNLFFFSREHISRKFKEETGLPLSKYVTKLKIDQARKWLKETEESIYSISLMLGYQDEKYFSKLFKKETGTTPSEFRAQFVNGSKE